MKKEEKKKLEILVDHAHKCQFSLVFFFPKLAF